MASPQRILVTGAGGFVGRHLMPVLAEAYPKAELTAAAADLGDPAAVEAEVRTRNPDACVHLAAVAAIADARDHPERAWRINLHGTLALARALSTHAPKATLVYASSADVYGASFRSGAALDEGALLAPLNVYAATKAAADLALGAMAAEGLHVIRVRPFNHTGPGQSPAFVVAAFAEQVARIWAGLQPPWLRTGALDPMRDFLDVRDVCRGYALCLAHADRMASGTVLNLASGQSRRVGDVLAALLKLARIGADAQTDPHRLRATDIASATGDATRAREMLGWAPAVPWEQTLGDVLADWQRRVQPDGRPSAQPGVQTPVSKGRA